MDGTIGAVMDWQQVRKVHRTQAGVFVKSGRILSLLATPSPYYRNEMTADRIRYGLGASAPGWVRRAFEGAIRDGYPIRVFFKRSPGVWEDIGFCRATSVEQSAGAPSLRLAGPTVVADTL